MYKTREFGQATIAIVLYSYVCDPATKLDAKREGFKRKFAPEFCGASLRPSVLRGRSVDRISCRSVFVQVEMAQWMVFIHSLSSSHSQSINSVRHEADSRSHRQGAHLPERPPGQRTRPAQYPFFVIETPACILRTGFYEVFMLCWMLSKRCMTTDASIRARNATGDTYIVHVTRL
jgi:hypothetical protein